MTSKERRRRPDRSSRWAASSLAALSCAVMVACGDDADAPGSGASSLEPVTSRGLAAEVLSHVDPETVDDVSGSDPGSDGWVAASVDAHGSDVSGLFVEVTPPVSGEGRRCDDQAGTVIECDEGPPYVSLVAHGRDDLSVPAGGGAGGVESVPVLEGWYIDPQRGSVMVLLYGRDTRTSRRLALDLLGDRLLGKQTSAASNRAGRDIAGFHKLTLEATVDSIERAPSPTEAGSSSPQR